MNGGECFDRGGGFVVCHCDPPYTGTLCEITGKNNNSNKTNKQTNKSLKQTNQKTKQSQTKSKQATQQFQSFRHKT